MKAIRSQNAPAPIGPYSQAIRFQNLLFVSGQIPLDPQSGQLVGAGDVQKQTERVMESLKAVLSEGGSSLAQVLKCTIFIKDMNDFPKINEVYARYFTGENPPARACVEVARLPKDVLVEIDCIAYA